MKKSLQLFFTAALFASANMLAQPTLTATGINPVVGDVMSAVGYTAAVNPGSAGANQTWNLAIPPATPSTGTMVTVGSTTYGSSFPTANVATSGSGNAYYKTSAAAFQYCGGVNGTTPEYYYNPEDFLHFPCTYNSTFTDAFACTYTSSTTIYRAGTCTVTADGYGTLTTPAGTFSNVMRIHFQDAYRDSGNISGFPYIADFQTDEYLWYLNNNHSAIASVMSYTFGISGNNQVTQLSTYATNVIVGVEEAQTQSAALDLFPNPVKSHLNVDLKIPAGSSAELKFVNALGASVTIPHFGLSSEHNVVDVGTLPDGIYFVQVYMDGTLSQTRRFVVAR